MPLYLFGCANGHEFERLSALGAEEAACLCGLAARRLASFAASVVVNHAILPHGEQRQNLSLFKEATAERADLYRRAEEHFERPIASRNLWKAAKKKAAPAPVSDPGPEEPF